MAQLSKGPRVAEDLKSRLAGVARNLVFEVYGPDGMPWGTPFSELEDVSIELGQCLSRMIMEEAASKQADQVLQAPPEYAVCPTCGQPVAESEARSRPLITQAGEIEWDEPRRYCRRCRRSFFPSGEESTAGGPRGSQSGGASEGGLRRGQWAVFSSGPRLIASSGRTGSSRPTDRTDHRASGSRAGGPAQRGDGRLGGLPVGREISSPAPEMRRCGDGAVRWRPGAGAGSQPRRSVCW